MKIQLRDIPVLATTDYSIDAKIFNTLRLASLRLKSPVRITLPGLRTLDILIEHDLWLVVDRSLDDLPIVAWDHFINRLDLHSPVSCRVRYFHFHAAVVSSKSLLLASTQLARKMGQRSTDEVLA